MDVAIVIVMLMFFVFGVLLGYKVGQTLGAKAETSKQYWLYNLLVVLVGIVLSALVSALGLRSLAALTIGLIAGGIMGLKFGYGKSVGIWERHDRAFRVNADQVEAAEADRRAEERGETPQEARERELISVGPREGGNGKQKESESAHRRSFTRRNR